MTIKTDHIYEGQRAQAWEYDFTYYATDGCWRAEYQAGKFQAVWCLVVNGNDMSGTLTIPWLQVTQTEVHLKRK